MFYSVSWIAERSTGDLKSQITNEHQFKVTWKKEKESVDTPKAEFQESCTKEQSHPWCDPSCGIGFGFPESGWDGQRPLKEVARRTELWCSERSGRRSPLRRIEKPRQSVGPIAMTMYRIEKVKPDRIFSKSILQLRKNNLKTTARLGAKRDFEV